MKFRDYECNLGTTTRTNRVIKSYTTDGFKRAEDELKKTKAAALSRVTKKAKVATAAAAVESRFRSLMDAVKHCGTSFAIVQQDSANFADSREAMSSAKGAVDTVMTEVVQLLRDVQKDDDYKSPKSRPTYACMRALMYLTCVREVASTTLKDSNKQAFLTDLGNQLHQVLSNHWRNYTVSQRGGERLHLDLSKYVDFVRSFEADPTVNEKFETLSSMAHVFTTEPGGLLSLLQGTPSIFKDAQRFIQRREDYESAGLAAMLSSFWASS